METVLRKSVAPYYGVAATWVLYALVFDLYRPPPVSHRRGAVGGGVPAAALGVSGCGGSGAKAAGA